MISIMNPKWLISWCWKSVIVSWLSWMCFQVIPSQSPTHPSLSANLTLQSGKLACSICWVPAAYARFDFNLSLFLFSLPFSHSIQKKSVGQGATIHQQFFFHLSLAGYGLILFFSLIALPMRVSYKYSSVLLLCVHLRVFLCCFVTQPNSECCPDHTHSDQYVDVSRQTSSV